MLARQPLRALALELRVSELALARDLGVEALALVFEFGEDPRAQLFGRFASGAACCGGDFGRTACCRYARARCDRSRRDGVRIERGLDRLVIYDARFGRRERRSGGFSLDRGRGRGRGRRCVRSAKAAPSAVISENRILGSLLPELTLW